MKKLLIATSTVALLAGAAAADDVKLGVLLGFTGPIESMAPSMGAAAELAMSEVSESGKFLGGKSVTSVRADATCVDAAAATAAAERLITSEGVSAIVGAACSGATLAVNQNVARPNGIGHISPGATSPSLSEIEDDGLFFRTAPSDARGGELMAEILIERGITSAAVTYTNNDYGKGLSDSFIASFEKMGGSVTINAAHEDEKADYSAEVGALASAGGDVLVVVGYADKGGKGIIQGALDTGAFETFVLPDGMASEAMIAEFGSDLDGSFGQVPGTDSNGAEVFGEMAAGAGFGGTDTFAAESYDAAALIMLSMQAAGTNEGRAWTDKVMEIANAPGTPILPGELGKALELIAAGEDIDYVGASAVELIGGGESGGSYREFEVKDGKMETVKFR